MRWGINLRGDLAKLDDVEIASRYEALIAEKEAAILAMPKYTRSKLFYALDAIPLVRGPLHARIFYRMQWLLLALYVALKWHDLVLPQAYMLECELRDVTDEIERRVAKKKAIPVT
jgi:hypothetical protein